MKKMLQCSVLSIVILISCLIVPFPAVNGEDIEVMPDTYLSYSDFYEEINANLDKIEINVIGDYDFETSFDLKDEEGNICDRIDLSGKVESKDDYSFKTAPKSGKGNLKSIIISNDEAKDFSNFEGKEKIEDALEQGYFAVFMADDLKTMDVIWGKYFNSEMTTKSDDNDENIPYACYIVKNKIGEYFTGTFFTNADALQSEKDETILYHLWCLKDIYNYTKNTEELKKELDQKAQDAGAFTVSANVNDGELFSIGTSWRSICNGAGWHQNVYGSDPSFWEWINFFYLVNGESGNHYYAWAIEYWANPKWNAANGITTNYIDYQSDAAKYMSQGKLRNYFPKTTPQNGSYTFSFGASLSSTNTTTANIGYSRSVSTIDLEIKDTTDVNYGKIRFNYKTVLGFYTNYAKNTSSNGAIFIYKDEGKTGKYTFHHYRKANFTCYGSYSAGFQSTYNNSK